jgi:putative ABC transport system substrate-binding protein
LRAGFRDLGYLEGQNLSIEARYAAGVLERLPVLAAELAALNPRAIVAGALPTVMAIRRVTNSIPVVMSAISVDPTAIGLAQSLSKPGGNFTGFWLETETALMAKRLELLKLAVPGISRVGVVVNPTDPTDDAGLQQLPVSAQALYLEVRILEVRSADQFEPVFSRAVQDGLQALCISQSPLFNENRLHVTELATRLRLPAVYGFREFATAGGLLSYAANLSDIYRRAAGVVDRILKGAKPGDIPIERPTRFELVINLKTARELGLTVPERFVLIADEVIE